MNCKQCEKHIVATTQIMWRGYPFHADCIGEAVAQYRAKTEVPSSEHNLPDDYFAQLENSMEDDQFYEDEITQYEEGDDLEDVIDRLDEVNGDVPYVDDEILNQIPPTSDPIQMPAGAQIVAPRAIIFPPQGSQSKLMVHAGAQRIDRAELFKLPLPEETDTFKPVAFHQLIDVVEEALAFRHIRITGEEFAVTPDGMKLFSVLQVNADYEGVRFAIGLRTSNDKSMRLGIVSGYRVFCCDNLAFSGDFNPMLVKHSKKLDLTESVAIAIDRIQRSWQPLRTAIDFKREHFLEEPEAKQMLYELFNEHKLPVSMMRTTHKEFFIEPSHQEFSEKTLWSFENAVTTAMKKLKPISMYENTAKLGRFLARYIKTA